LYERILFAELDIGVDPNWRISDYDKFWFLSDIYSVNCYN
jgi:hypothetical protein